MGVRIGAWKPLAADFDAQPKISDHRLVILHTMDNTLAKTDTFFRQGGYKGVESHFGVGADGTVWQWQDTDHQADANVEANGHAISIETADRGAGFPDWSDKKGDVPAWTDAQIDAIVTITAECCKHHGIPATLVADSRPGNRGIASHRLGIDPWRVSGGEKWSLSRGKVCPGDRRIAQIPAVVDRVRKILEPH